MTAMRLCLGSAIACLAISLLVAPAAAQERCEPEKVAQKYPSLAGKTLKIGADPQTPPYVMRDGSDFNKVVGIDADLARAVFDCVGVKTEFFLGGWSGLLPAVVSGQIDMMWDNLYHNANRAKTVDFVIYMTAATGALMSASNKKPIDELAKFCGETVAFGLGSNAEVTTNKADDECKAANKPAINKMPFQDLAAGLRLIDSGRADVMLWDLGFVDSLAGDNPTKYRRSFKIMSGYKIGVGIRKGNEDLLKAVHDSLAVLQKNGTQKKIIEKYKVSADLELPTAILRE